MRKFLPYIFILAILIGLFNPMSNVVYAEPCTGGTAQTGPLPVGCDPADPNSTGLFATTQNLNTPAPQTTGNAFADEVTRKSCIDLTKFDMAGCLVKIFYFFFYTIPRWMLWAVAYVFNLLLAITLGGEFIGSSKFVAEAWTVVRDLSNIFFILILLYIAFKMILDLGLAEAQKMIVKVILVALFINFSMFFTKIVIDSSNIIALIFYNKISVETNIEGKPRYYQAVANEKDVAGGITAAFDPTKSLSPEIFEQAKTDWYNGTKVTRTEVDSGTLAALILISGLILWFAIYAFFISSIAFLGRLIELWILIIFSPFAFMSMAVTKFEGMEYLGWNDWFKRLIKVAFMAPIFMFFLYLIFKIVHADIFADILTPNNGEGGLIGMILKVALPALVILAMLLKATEFAKKGGGQFGEMFIKGGTLAAGLVGGLALGAASGGTTLLAGVGGTALNNLGKKAGNNFAGNTLRDLGGGLQKKNFDIRNTGVGKSIASATGINFGEGRKGGWTAIKEKQAEKHTKRAAELEKRWTGGEKGKVEEAKADLAHAKTELTTGKEARDLEDAKETLKAAELPIKAELEHLNASIAQFERDLNNAVKSGDKIAQARAEMSLDQAKKDKKALRDGAGGGVGLDTLEKDVRAKQRTYSDKEKIELLPLEKAVADAKRALDKKSGEVIHDYANKLGSKGWGTVILKGGLFSLDEAKKTATKIRQHAKTDGGH